MFSYYVNKNTNLLGNTWCLNIYLIMLSIIYRQVETPDFAKPFYLKDFIADAPKVKGLR